jgi:hypothetical protein
MASVPKNIVYILHIYMHESAFIDWSDLTSKEISFQFGGLKRTQIFYVTYYLIFSIEFFHVFEDWSRERSIDFKVEPVSAWYPTLWKHKD